MNLERVCLIQWSDPPCPFAIDPPRHVCVRTRLHGAVHQCTCGSVLTALELIS